jgi:ABC-type polysaccharide/polyol phosphate export permease
MNVVSNLKVRYKRSVLGFFWSLLGPVLNYGILAVVFYYGSKMQDSNYFLHVFPGILIFTFLNAGINNGATSILAGEMYIKKIYLPKSIFALNTVFTDFFNFLFSFVAMILLGVIFGILPFSIYWIYLIPVLVLALIFVTGITLILGVLTVFFRDLLHIIPIVIQAGFYLSPVLYKIEDMPEKVLKIIRWNPLYYFIEAFRYPLEHSAAVPTDLMLTCCAIALAAFLVGNIFIIRNENKIIFKL